MRKQFLLVALGFSVLWSNSALSYLGEKDLKYKENKDKISQSKAAGCAPATAKLYLEFNDVRCLIENGGSMFQDRAAGVAAYEIPKVADGGTKHYAIYAGALWMGGTDINGQLKLAAIRFRRGNDFWSGPLTVTPGSGNFNPFNPQGNDAFKDFGEATITPEQCLAYDKFYTIRKAEVIAFNSWFEACNPGLPGVPVVDVSCNDVEVPSNEVLNRIENWPAHGDVSNGQDYYLAPFYDRDADGNYNPLTAGDYPWYDDILERDDIECGADRRISLFGDETHWWVFNDKGNIHTETSGEPIGMEIRAQAFAFATNDEINRMTFYNYELINRGTQTLYETYFSQFLDADVGNFSDDYAGCDVSRGLGYMYNGDNNDETNGQNAGYGLNPPAIGVDFFEGPYKDPDGKDNGYYPSSLLDAIADSGIVYKGIGIGFGDSIIDNERFGMTRFTYFTGSDAVFPYQDPTNAAQYYNFMKGKWANGSDLVYGGLGYAGSSGATSTLSTYMFPGESDPLGWATNGVYVNDTWDETTANNPPKDRRFVQSAGPFTLKPGAVNNITVGIVYGRGFDGDLFSSVRALKRADTKAQALFDACFKIFDPPMAPKLSIQELNNEVILMLDNPGLAHNNYKEKYLVEDEINITIDTLADGSEPDRFYRFEGYQIFQLKNSSTSISDISDPTKAQLVAQCDIENGVSRIINFEFDESLGFAVPVEKVNGTNNGIKHTFSITEDFFALGERTLVNYKTYYYVAIAYAYNNFLEYNPNDPLLLGGQQTPYVSSRLGYDGGSIAAVSAIPHNPISEAGGTVQSVEYGTTPRITRLDGTGNGGRNLELTQESTDYIVANGFMDNPTYDYGAGPINVKVVDPLNVADGYFECIFDDSGYNSTGDNGADSAVWTINRYDKKDGVLLESITGSVNILQDNEEVIPQWGVSVQINQIKYTGTTTAQTTKPITSSIDFADSSKRWLSFITDQDGFYFNNWIRSGTTADTALDASPIYTVPACYSDEMIGEVALDEEKLFTSLVGGGVAPYRLTGYQCDFMPFAYYNNPTLSSNSGVERTAARLAFLPSVDIVLTSDQSKWTRCPVIELGRDENTNYGNAKPGALRKSPSVGKDGQADNTGTGMSWFPGYAIDVETGARLYMAFGENSFLGLDNGSDMIWNPTDRFVDNSGNAIAGGQHPIYVFSHNNQTINKSNTSYDFPYYNPNNESVNEVYDLMQLVETGSSTAKRRLYGSMSWIANTILERDQELLSTAVTIKLRVEKEYKKFVATGVNNGLPMYSWSMNDIYTQTGRDTQLAKVLDIINVVPNPYYAFSEYERNRLDTKVKITNLPEVCTVSIYGVNGKLIRTFKKDSPQTYLDWDLNNHSGIPIASGIYLIHVDIPDIGEKVIKFLGGSRQVDLQNL
jgi:hypothetical protein